MMRELIDQLREKTVPASMMDPFRKPPGPKAPKMQQKTMKMPMLPGKKKKANRKPGATSVATMIEKMAVGGRRLKIPKTPKKEKANRKPGATSVADMIERMGEIVVPVSLMNPPMAPPRPRAPRMQQRKVAKSKMRTPAPPPKRGSAYAIQTQMVDGREDSGSVSARAWSTVRYWEKDHGKPQMTESLDSVEENCMDPDVSMVIASMDRSTFRRMAGLTLLEPLLEKKSAARPTMPDREGISGQGNKSGIPRTPGTGAGDYDPKDMKTPQNSLKKAIKKADDDEPDDDDYEDEDESQEEWSTFKGTFDHRDILALAEEAMPLVNSSRRETKQFSYEPEKQAKQMLDLVLDAPAIRPGA